MSPTRRRTLALVMSTPMALFAYNPMHALAAGTQSHSMCDGHAVTMTVSSSSPHVVDGTNHRDVIRVNAAHHVVNARGETTSSAARPAMTSSMARAATTSCSPVPAMTR